MLWWTLRQLKSDRADVRLEALKKLGEIQDPRLKDISLQLLAQDSDTGVRRQACLFVAAFQDTDKVAPLVAALKDPDDKVKITAAKALGIPSDDRVIHPLIEALKDKNDKVKTSAAISLANTFDKRAIPHLAEAMIHSDSKTREKIEEQLIHFGAAAVPEFVKMLSHSPPLCIRALRAIGKLRASDATDSIIATARMSSDPSVRNAAIETLGRLEPGKSMGLLIELVKDETTSKAAGLALKEIGKKDPGALLPLLQDQDPGVRILGLESLKGVKDKRFVEPFLRTLNDSEAKAQLLARQALQDILGRSSFERLMTVRSLPAMMHAQAQASPERTDFLDTLTAAFEACSIPWKWCNSDWKNIAEALLLFDDPRVRVAFSSFLPLLLAEFQLTFDCKDSCSFCVLCVRHARAWSNVGRHYSVLSIVWRILIECGFRPIQPTKASAFPIDGSYADRFRRFVTAMKEIDCMRMPERWALEFLTYIGQIETAPVCGECISSVMRFLKSNQAVVAKSERQKTALDMVPVDSTSPFRRVKGRSLFYRCPSCNVVLRKRSVEGVSDATGFTSCSECGTSFSYSDVYYDGKYDLPEVEGRCLHCSTDLRGPVEELLGRPCPNCNKNLPSSVSEE